MSLSHKDVAKILEIIDQSHYTEILLEVDDLKLRVSRSKGEESLLTPATTSGIEGANVAAQQTALAVERRTAQAAATATVGSGSGESLQEAVEIRAPLTGRFFRAASPGARPFVEIGMEVKSDDQVCLIEAMKLFHSVSAGVVGTVVAILVENAQVVETGQVLVKISPTTTKR